MPINIAINGFGRIGRNIFRAIHDNNKTSNISENEYNIVAINDLADPSTLVHLLKYDSVHGNFDFDSKLEDNVFYFADKKIIISNETNPENCPWDKLDVDIVFECTGHFAAKDKSMSHIRAGAKKVLISAPAGNDVDATIVYGINHDTIKPEHTVISNASCTTNCLAPLIKPIQSTIGLESGLMTTIHAYTSDQNLTDVAHKDLRRARAAGLSMIPTKTGAAAAIGLVIPELAGKLDGFAMRVPTANVSVVDLTFIPSKKTDTTEINHILTSAAASELQGVLEVNSEPLVSVDFNHNSASSVADLTQTRVLGDCVKVLAWYDNEWGFANRMLDTARVIMAKSTTSSTETMPS